MAASILRWIDELAFAWKGGVVHCPPNAVRRRRDNWEMGDAVLVDRRRNPRRVHVCRDEPDRKQRQNEARDRPTTAPQDLH